MRSLGETVKQRRIQLGMGIKHLAERVGSTHSYISLIEKNKRVPSEEILHKLAEQLALPFDLLRLQAGRFPAELEQGLRDNAVDIAQLLRRQLEAKRADILFPPSVDLSDFITSSQAQATFEAPGLFDQEIVAGKNTTVYNTHSYHTKVPHQAIKPLIEHYTVTGDLVFDPFCGSGLTGVAALETGRRALLSDFSPAAVHIAQNYTTPCNLAALRAAYKRLHYALGSTFSWLYGTQRDDRGQPAIIEYTVWSDVFACPECSAEMVYWDCTYDTDRNQLRSTSLCPGCGRAFRKRDLVWIGEVPIRTNLKFRSAGKWQREERPTSAWERDLIAEIRNTPIPYWYPDIPFDSSREMWRGAHGDAGIRTVADFYTPRNLFALAALREEIFQASDAPRIVRALAFAFTGCLNRASKRYQWNPKRPTNVMTGTLYISSLRYEWNVWSLFTRKYQAIERFYQLLGSPVTEARVFQCSATNLKAYVSDQSVDYIFADPPFGSNIFYADSSLLWEAWLNQLSDESQEMVISRKRGLEEGGKTLDDYGAMLTDAFTEMSRVLKPDRYASITFNSADGRIWQTFQNALHDAGFEVQSVVSLDKKQRSIKGVKADLGLEQVPLYDVILNVERCSTRSVAQPDVRMETETGESLIVSILRDHLKTVNSASDGGIDLTSKLRRTEYLHSMVMRKLLEQGRSVEGVSLAAVADLCQQHFHSFDGLWYLPDELPDKVPGSRYMDVVLSPYGCVSLEYCTSVSTYVTRHAKPNGRPSTKYPFSRRVKGRRNTPAYNAHSYPTKVPPESIVPFIEHYTEPGELVLDPFSGSGMVGIAAALTSRACILNDLAVVATHLAYNHTCPCAPERLETFFEEFYNRVRPQFEEWYTTPHNGQPDAGYIHYTIWSAVYVCPLCQETFALWDAAVDQEKGVVRSRFPCPHCETELTKGRLRQVGEQPVLVNYEIRDDGGQPLRVNRPPVEADLALIQKLKQAPIKHWVPAVAISPDREMYNRSALHLRGVHEVADFYTARNLRALATLWHEIQSIDEPRLRQVLSFAFTNTAWHGTKMRRYNARGGQRPLTGTLYIPQLSSEVNVLEVLRNKIRQLVRFYAWYRPKDPDLLPAISLGSATNLDDIPDNTIDYIFTDPPFGGNIFYADCNIIWESWLGGLTPTAQEAVINRSVSPDQGGKTLDDYRELMRLSLREMYRVLKPGRWVSMVFQSTDGQVWRALQEAAFSAGFELTKHTGLDRAQMSMKGYKGRSGKENVAHHDVIMNLRKPVRPRAAVNDILRLASREVVLSELRRHLAGLRDNNTEQRTTQYLHSLTMRFLLSNGYDAGRWDYADVRRLCQVEFEFRGEGWYLK